MAHPIHLRPTADLAPRVLLPGDPGRALQLAQALLERPLMFNHHRGLWGYTGTAADGEPLTIQSTGMGGPSAAIVVHELIDLGATRLVRVGTCGSLRADVRLGALVVATEALCGDGTSVALGARGRVAPDATLLGALREAPGAVAGPVLTTDVFYGGERAAPAEAIAVEMEAAAIFQVAAARGAAAACVLAVTDELAGGDRRRMDAEAVEAAGEAVGRAGAAALGAVEAPAG